MKVGPHQELGAENPLVAQTCLRRICLKSLPSTWSLSEEAGTGKGVEQILSPAAPLRVNPLGFHSRCERLCGRTSSRGRGSFVLLLPS